MSQNNLIVAFGGVSPEHEVSVLTAFQAMAALENSNYQCIPLYISKSGRWFTGSEVSKLENFKDLNKIEKEATPCTFVSGENGQGQLRVFQAKGFFTKDKFHSVHAVLCAFHGSEGENGSFQGICETYNLPYSGSGVLASALGMDKVKAKMVAASNGVPVTKSVNFFESDWITEQEGIINVAEEFGYPLIVKPVTLGSSIGVAKAENREELITAVETSFRYDGHLLIEEGIHPLLEINCSVLGTPEECRPSVCEKPTGSSETLSFRDKYQSGDGLQKGMASADRVIPADISEELTKKIQNLSVKTFSALDASGVARLDFLVNSNTEEVFFNEINTIPGSFSFYLWEKTDLDFKSLLEELIKLAIKIHQARNGRVRSYETNLLSEKAAKGIKGLKGTKG